MDLGDFHRLFEGHVRHDGGHALGKHGLARSGRTGHQHVVPSRNGDLQRAFRHRLPLDVGKIHVIVHLAAHGFEPSLGDGLRLAAVQEIHHAVEVVESVDVDAVDEARLRRVVGGDDELFLPFLHRRDEQRHHSVDVPERAVQGELADHDKVLIQSARHRFGAYQQPHRDGQIQACALLLGLCGSEVDRDAADGIRQTAVFDGGAHPLFGLLRRRRGEPHGLDARDAVVDVHLHVDLVAVEPFESVTFHRCQHPKPLKTEKLSQVYHNPPQNATVEGDNYSRARARAHDAGATRI